MVTSKKKNPKKSLAAEAVAKDVISTIRNGRIPNLQEIQQKHGYSKESARASKGTGTKTYKTAMKDVINGLEKERARILEALTNKNLDKEKYRDLVDGLDKLTKNIQLLGGGKTSNDSITISWDK